MTEKDLELIYIDGVSYSINELRGYIESCEELCEQNFILKQRCRTLTAENQSLKLEIKDMKFTRNYLTSEEAGKAFARELLGKPMTASDLAEEKAIADGEAHYAVFCGDDDL